MSRYVAAAGLLALAACGGTSVVLGPSPAPVPTPTPGTSTTASLTVVVPDRGPYVRYRYRVSPFTRSVSIAIGQKRPRVFAVLPHSPGCARERGATACTFVFPANPGSQPFAASTYSGPGASGYELDRARVTVAIQAGVTNALAVALSPVISNTNDDGPGTMRQAIASAGAGDTIVYVAKVPGTIALRSVIPWNRTARIVGPGSSKLRVSGGGTSEILFVAREAVAALSGMTLADGIARDGGAMYVYGRAVLENVVFADNTARESGGAIYARSALAIRSCTFENNLAGGRPGTRNAFGGAVFDAGGSLKIERSRFTHNRGEADAGAAYVYGGAVYVTGKSEFDHNTFASNSVQGSDAGYGGAVFAAGTASATGDIFRKNLAKAAKGSASGGAFYAQTAPSLSGETFEANAAIVGGRQGSAAGGAVASTGGRITGAVFSKNSATAAAAYGGALQTYGKPTVEDSRFVSNRAVALKKGASYGGAIAMIGGVVLGGTIEKNESSTQGGGIWISPGGAGPAAVENSTISSNDVVAPASLGDGGGGISNSGRLRLTGTTISDNAVTGGSHGAGGGLLNAGTLTAVNSTVVGNSSNAGSGGGMTNVAPHGVELVNVTIYRNSARGDGGNVETESGSNMSLANSIVASGAAAQGPDIYNAGKIVSLDYDLVQTAVAGNPFKGTTTHNLEADPALLPLADNGGPTWTNAETSHSPGAGYIPLSVCHRYGVTTDQRGYPRGGHGDRRCDVGAFELQ